MRLDELIAAEEAGENAGIEISGLAYDSRKVRLGTLFFCVPGFRSDGHDFAAQAVRDGAVALVVERPLGLGVPEVVVPSARAAMGLVAARFYGDPTSQLKVVGITGTNGKTTTAFLVRALLEAAGEQTGLLGTVTSIVGGQERATDWRSTGSPIGQRTTPEAIDLQAECRAMLDAGDRACAMEVSSHALALGRTAGVRFAAAVFTNLTQDHLDYHSTMEDYYQAKRLLFLPTTAADDDEDDVRPGASVVNVGDPYGRRLAQELDGVITFAVDEDDAAGHDDVCREADYRATDLRCDMAGCRFTLHTPAGVSEVMLPMPGRFNVANALGALAVVHALGHDLDTLIAGLERGVHVPGRFESVRAGQAFAVLVDYAHTPDSLQSVLRAARELARGRVICVFGAGGDRDRGKRPQMGEIAARLADLAVVTSDNPRSEDPEAIVAEIVAGIPIPAGAGRGGGRGSGGAVHVEVDRRAAIEWAIAEARADDVVVIAGKGHEQGQELAGGVRLPFDDVAVAREALGAHGAGRAAGGRARG